MSVRGTKFRVTVYKAKDGLIYTLTEVKDGEVLVRLKTTDGTYNGVEKLFTPGQSALIRGNSDFSEFVTSDMLDNADLSKLTGEDTVLMLAYDSLPEDGLERLIALLENGGIIEETDETEDEIKTQVALRPTPTPILKPTPSPTPSPRPTGPSQEELLRQLLALMETTPSPTPTYIPTSDDDEEESEEDNSDDSEPEPTNVVNNYTTPGYDYDPSTGILKDSNGTQIGQVTNGQLAFNNNSAGATIMLPITLSGTNYGVAYGNIDIENSHDSITYDEPNLSTSAMISAVQNSTHQVNIQTSNGGLHANTINGVRTYDGSGHDVATFNQLQTAGPGEYLLWVNGSTSWVESTVDSSGNITQYNDFNNQTYTVTGNAPVYDANNSRITGTVEDPNNAGQTLNFTLDATNGFVTT